MKNQSNSSQTKSKPETTSSNHFLVCGLGSLGQHCVEELTAFGVNISAIELSIPSHWEVDGLDRMLETLYKGDCRQNTVLETTNISRFRAVLVVTSNDRVNIDTAMAIRLLNPDVRIVMRSSKEGLNALLAKRLGNFIAFEPSKLSAPAFTLAAMGDTLLACFPMADQYVQVVRRPTSDYPAGKTLLSCETKSTRVLALESQQSEFQDFYQWDMEDSIGSQDSIITLEIRYHPDAAIRKNISDHSLLDPLLDGDSNYDSETAGSPFGQVQNRIKTLGPKLVHWILKDQIRRVTLFSSCTIIILLCAGVFLFNRFGPGISAVDAFYNAIVLLLGGYPDLLGSDLTFSLPIPNWLRFLGLLLTLSGTVFMGLIYAVITQYLLSARFRFGKAEKLPFKNHVIVYGIRKVGREVANQLKAFGIPLIGVVAEDKFSHDIPMIIQDDADLDKCLENANLMGADSLIALSRDELSNLEIGLLAKSIKPDLRLVIRTYDERFSSHLARLWSQALILSTSALAAKAFTASAFGENVPFLFRIHTKPILVTEYRVEENDTLVGMVLAKFRYGYGVIPLMLTKAGSNEPIWLPVDDMVLETQDTLVVLATIEGLQRIEKGELMLAEYELHIDMPLRNQVLFDGANILARMTGVALEECRNFMDNLPAVFPEALYLHQAKLLQVMLKRNMINAVLRQRDF